MVDVLEVEVLVLLIVNLEQIFIDDREMSYDFNRVFLEVGIYKNL